MAARGARPRRAPLLGPSASCRRINDAHATPAFNRILLKLSGEALMGPRPSASIRYGRARRRRDRRRPGARPRTCLVVGGGNIFRGLAAAAQGLRPDQRRLHGHAGDGDERAGGAERARADRRRDRVQSAIPMATVCEPYIRRRAARHMEKGRDRHFRRRHRQSLLHHRHRRRTARRRDEAATRCSRAPRVDGVYDADPKKVPTRQRYESLSFNRVLADDLKVMDASAVALVPRQQYPDRRLQHPRAGQSCPGAARRGHRDDRATEE